jgi:REP element-mobilizing transposase RayT
MSTYTQILYQIVFSTKNRKRTLSSLQRPELCKYIWGILENKKCHPYWINGIEDHLHLLTHIHPSVCLSDLVKDIKLGTSDWIKKGAVFAYFDGWQEGYAGFTYSYKQKDILIKYIQNQESHHKVKTYIEELIELLKEHGITYDEKFLK